MAELKDNTQKQVSAFEKKLKEMQKIAEEDGQKTAKIQEELTTI